MCVVVSRLWAQLASSVHLIICTVCDEEPCILSGNSTDASLSGALGNRLSSPTSPLCPSPAPHHPPLPILFLAVVLSHLCGFFFSPSLYPTPCSPIRFIFPPLCLCCRLPILPPLILSPLPFTTSLSLTHTVFILSLFFLLMRLARLHRWRRNASAPN